MADPCTGIIALRAAVDRINEIKDELSDLAERLIGTRLNGTEIILLLSVTDGMPYGRLAELSPVGINISAPIKGLVAAGVIVSAPHPDDKRRLLVSHTVKGRNLARKLHDALDAIMARRAPELQAVA